MRPALLALATLLLGIGDVSPAAAQAQKCRGASCAGRLVYFGTRGKAIFAARFDPRSGRLSDLGQAAAIERPTWLTRGITSRILYAVSETGNDGQAQASVYSLVADRASGKLTVINQTASGGGGATHLALDPRSNTLFVANYGTGQVAALPIGADGSLGAAASVQANYGSGPKPRQKGPHAHAVAIDPSDHFLLSADLGADRIFVYRFDPHTRQLTPAASPFEQAQPGSGPRHLVFHPNGRLLYVNSELSGEVSGYRWDARAGLLHKLWTISTLPQDYAGERSAAEVAMSKDGRFLYVGNRGEDSIVTYAVDGNTGALHESQRIAAGGKLPWSFALDPSGRWMLVANQGSNAIAVFRVDHASGKLEASGNALAVTAPSSIAFLGDR